MRWKVFLDKIEEYFSCVDFYVFAVRWVEPNNIYFSLFFVTSCIYIYFVLELCFYPHLSKASWYEITESLKISSEEDTWESRDSIESGSSLMTDGGWLDSMFIYFI